jgi:hypothetical protein
MRQEGAARRGAPGGLAGRRQEGAPRDGGGGTHGSAVGVATSGATPPRLARMDANPVPERRPKTWLPRGEAVLPHLLVALLVLLFVAAPLADLGVIRRPMLGILLVIVVLAGLLAMGRPKRRLTALVHLLGIALLAMQASTLVVTGPRLAIANDLIAGAFIAALAAVLLAGVFGRGRITVTRIVGAVAVYLLIGLFFSVAFDLVERLAPGAFAMGPMPTEHTTASSRLFYLSMVTLTSTGFGDMAPVHPFARSLVMLEAVIGQVYLTVLVGWLVAVQIEHRSRGKP